MAQTKAQKKRAIEGHKKALTNAIKKKGYDMNRISVSVVDPSMYLNTKKPCEWCNGEGQFFRNRSEMESGEGVICKKCRGYGY